MKSRIILIAALVLVLISCKKKQSNSERMNQYFEEIKTDTSTLKTFFKAMPKGAELHHHAIGSNFAETLIDLAVASACYINPSTYELYYDEQDALNQIIPDENSLPIAIFLNQNEANLQNTIDAWSVRNYKEKGRDGHDWFFATFNKFKKAFFLNTGKCLSILNKRASDENVQYLETMIAVPNVRNDVLEMAVDLPIYNKEEAIDNQFENWFTILKQRGMDSKAIENADSLNAYYNRTSIPEGVNMSFMAYVLRIYPNLSDVFSDLMLSFETYQRSKHLVGINFVAPEDNFVALKDYKMHMAMFSFLKKKYPETNISLHSGEIVEGKGSVTEKDFDSHIWDAILIGKAKRIGHGVDVLKEKNSDSLLSYMKANQIAVEINLRSNEVILETNKENHPFISYWQAEVPIALSTDDAGILRTHLADQYLLAIQYAPQMGYSDIKELVYNSINYSFSKDKETLLKNLDGAFEKFESKILESI